MEERQEQLCGEREEARERVASTRARTLVGMLAKLAFIAPDVEAGTSETILYSVAVDYKLGVEGV